MTAQAQPEPEYFRRRRKGSLECPKLMSPAGSEDWPQRCERVGCPGDKADPSHGGCRRAGG